MKITHTNARMIVDFSQDEQKVIDWIITTYGEHEINLYIERMLDSRRAQMEDEMHNLLVNHILTNEEMVAHVGLHNPHLKSVIEHMHRKHKAKVAKLSGKSEDNQ